MRTREGNEINMALVVQKVLKDYQETWSVNNSLVEHVEIMKSQLELIKQHQQNAEKKTEGVTDDKANAADYAIELGREIAGSAYIYAKSINSATMKQQFFIPKKELTNVQGVVALSRLKELYKNLEYVLDKLNGKVTKEELQSFDFAIKEFENQIVNPRDVIIDREKSNDILSETVQKMKSNFKDMDGLMHKFKKTDFAREFKLARIVIDLGTRKDDDDEKGDNEKPKNDDPKDKGPVA